ncbi:murein biosynthesis integral membrane protein MurJ [Desulforamulus aquiferis]|uniref:Lipid II flippase MurJ n=1 Tax=Desulforamulus aquiferis TaxID=1397668 RepID=A0AAW7ZBT9_9FIRM|nr:lipid II flippase MurJ [Desulforamulus aquiferis]MDO7786852.1 lipid II flippase MurJ [Desulforamulus aquiferis]RYD01268.1 hypothetical protein N752_30190 [Desulforamulus aquiferis]
MFKAFLTIFSGGLLGKILGVLRELLLAALFGTTAPVGAYRIAQTATLVPINFFTAESLNAGFIPLYKRYLNSEPAKAQTLFWVLKSLIFLISIMIMLFLYFGASIWVKVMAPGFDSHILDVTASFVEVMSLSVPFYIIGSLLSYLEMGNDGYTLTSIRPSIQSIGLIAGTIAAFWFKQPVYLAWGFTGAYITFFILGYLRLTKLGLLTWPSNWIWPETFEVLKSFWQTIRSLLLLPFMLQGNIAVERIIASLMGVSVVAALDYAKFVTETGINLLAVPLGLAGLSIFSNISDKEQNKRIQQVITVILLITVPVSAFLAIHSETLVHLLYERGNFNRESVNLTQTVLLGLGLGFWAQVSSYVLIKIMNAQLRNREVVKYMGIALGANALTNILLYQTLGPLALGVGTSVYGIILFLLTIKALKITEVTLPQLFWLSIGVILYAPVGVFLLGQGWLGLALSTLIFLFFWVIYIAAVPLLRKSAGSLLEAFQPKVNQIMKKYRSSHEG